METVVALSGGLFLHLMHVLLKLGHLRAWNGTLMRLLGQLNSAVTFLGHVKDACKHLLICMEALAGRAKLWNGLSRGVARG